MQSACALSKDSLFAWPVATERKRLSHGRSRPATTISLFNFVPLLLPEVRFAHSGFRASLSTCPFRTKCGMPLFISRTPCRMLPFVISCKIQLDKFKFLIASLSTSNHNEKNPINHFKPCTADQCSGNSGKRRLLSQRKSPA